MKLRVTRSVDAFEKAVAVLLAVGLVVTVFYGVIVRYLPISGTQMAWSQELAQLLLVWFAFVTVGMVQREGTHFTVDVLRAKLSRVGRLVSELITVALVLGFLGYVLVDAVGFMESMVGSQTTVLRLPMILYTLPLVVCCVQGLVGTCAIGARAIKRRGEK